MASAASVTLGHFPRCANKAAKLKQDRSRVPLSICLWGEPCSFPQGKAFLSQLPLLSYKAVFSRNTSFGDPERLPAGWAMASTVVPSCPVLTAGRWRIDNFSDAKSDFLDFELTLELFSRAPSLCLPTLNLFLSALWHGWQRFLCCNSWLLTTSGPRIVMKAAWPAGSVLGLDPCRNVSGRGFKISFLLSECWDKRVQRSSGYFLACCLPSSYRAAEKC